MNNEMIKAMLIEEIAHTVADSRKVFTNNWTIFGAADYVKESVENDIYAHIEEHKDRVVALNMMFTFGTKWIMEAIDAELGMVTL